MIPRKLSRTLCGRAQTLGIAAALALSLAAGASAAGDKVGEVSLSIGVSRVAGERGSQAVTKGMAIHVGDRIETERGGHVHLRFVDGAYVSVRPGSRLVVESYKFEAARPASGEVRFRLESGVARAISGKLAESARDRFRLNTPIAAIGVRGTDFVVLAEQDRVRVSVHSGAIVLAPLGDGCASNALGPCSTAAARTLSADMGRVMLEFQPQLPAPRVVPINGIPAPDRVNPPTPYEPRASAGGTTANREPTNEVLAVQAVSGQPQTQVVDPPAPPPPPPPPVLPPLEPATMIWGRWAGAAWPGDTLTVAYAEGRPGREVTVGNQYFLLFRPESQQLTSLVSNLGRVDFRMRDAQVHLLRNGVAEPGSVNGGWLTVDFSTRVFGTGVDMSHPQAGSASLQAAGKVRDDGIFAVTTPEGRVAGALTLDGKEAGYFFEKAVPMGTFMGVTRWGR